MSKLLVAIDGSQASTRALHYAIDLAKRIGGCTLHVVTAHPEPVIYGEIQVYVPREKMEELQRKHSEDFLKPALETARAAGIDQSGEVVIGDAAAAIATRARELGCHSIVMGTRGMGAIGNLMLGSVATKVIHLTDLPVTLVK